MPVLEEIPFVPDVDKLFSRLGVDRSVDFASEVLALTERVGRVARPKAVFLECFVKERGEETVTIGRVTFTSRVLRANLESVHRVFPFVATCGVEMDALLGDYDDLLGYCLECLKEQALRAAHRYLLAHLKEVYGLRGISSMNPGSGDRDVWPLEQQAQLFALLGDVEGQVGVQLTDSFLMQPNKTLSGILFPTEVDFITCRLCRREVCPNRRAPFDAELWQKAHGTQ